MADKRNDGNTAAKNEARTPPEIFRKLDAEFHFDLDAAANEHNTLCRNFFAKSMPEPNSPTDLVLLPLGLDALEINWMERVRFVPTTFWCNPPYSSGNIIKFVHKAWLESGNGATVVLLIPADPSTEYFGFCFENADEIRFMQPRVKFNNQDGTPMKGSPTTGSMIVVFRPGSDGPAKVSIWRWKE